MTTDALTIQAARHAGLSLTGQSMSGTPEFNGTFNQWREFWNNIDQLKKTINK